MKKSLIPVLVLLPALLAGPVLADDSVSLSEQQFGDVTYLSGGVGDEEQRELRAREREFNVKLVFAERAGAYLGDVDLVLIDRAGEAVFEAYGVGPILLARVPKGRYRFQAIASGQVQEGNLEVSGKGHQERVLRW